MIKPSEVGKSGEMVLPPHTAGRELGNGYGYSGIIKRVLVTVSVISKIAGNHQTRDAC